MARLQGKLQRTWTHLEEKAARVQTKSAGKVSIKVRVPRTIAFQAVSAVCRADPDGSAVRIGGGVLMSLCPPESPRLGAGTDVGAVRRGRSDDVLPARMSARHTGSAAARGRTAMEENRGGGWNSEGS